MKQDNRSRRKNTSASEHTAEWRQHDSAYLKYTKKDGFIRRQGELSISYTQTDKSKRRKILVRIKNLA
jgi:hypothetical protein